MGLYAWVRPAFFSHNIVDHTWVTDFNLRTSTLGNLSAVMAASRNYWFCHGDFYTNGVPQKPIVNNASPSHGARCLVQSNNKKATGTIRYGIDGVCHQISNQVLYPTKQKVEKARGYILSRAIFGEYGLRQDEWDLKLASCRMPSMLRAQSLSTSLFLLRRARILFGVVSTIPDELNVRLTDLRKDIGEIGLAVSVRNESATDRAGRLNQRINGFLNVAADILEAQHLEGHYLRLFGFPPRVEVNLIDPEKFQFVNE